MLRTSGHQRLRLAAMSIAMILAVVGCTSQPAADSPPAAAGSSPMVTTPAAPTSASASPSATPTPTPKPKPTPPRRKAANGTDYAACNDGNCEVAVSKPLDFRLEADFFLSIVKVTRKGITVQYVAGGVLEAESYANYCIMRMSGGGFSSECTDMTRIPGRPKPKKGETILEFLGVTDGKAIVRLTTR